jgi:hypothetical protein
MVKCDGCGHIHWEEIPTHKETLDLIEEGVCSTARELADHEGISIQAASNRFRRLSELDVIEPVERRETDAGGYEKVWASVEE